MAFTKQVKPRIFVQCKCRYWTGALSCKVRVLILHFSILAFLTLTALRVYPGVCASVGRVLRVVLAGLLTIDFDHKQSSGRILGL